MSTRRKLMPRCLGRVGVRASQDHYVVGPVSVGGPDLDAVYDEVVAILDSPGLKEGEVRPRLRLRVALAPLDLAPSDWGKMLPLLVLGAVNHQRGGKHSGAEGVATGGSVVGHLLGEDDLHHVGGALAPVLGRPGHGKPAPLGQLPPHTQRELPVFVILVDRAGPPLRKLLLEEAAELLAEGLLRRCERQLHQLLLGSRPRRPVTATSVDLGRSWAAYG